MHSSGASRREVAKLRLKVEQTPSFRGDANGSARSAGEMDFRFEPAESVNRRLRATRRKTARNDGAAFRKLKIGNHRCFYPSNTASAPFTASALSITVRSSEPACTEIFSAKNRASVT